MTVPGHGQTVHLLDSRGVFHVLWDRQGDPPNVLLCVFLWDAKPATERKPRVSFCSATKRDQRRSVAATG